MSSTDLGGQASPDHPAAGTAVAEAVHPFDARGVARRFRHAAIFGALDVLTPGETMRFLNDHGPLPLLRQIAERYGEALPPIEVTAHVSTGSADRDYRLNAAGQRGALFGRGELEATPGA